MFFKDYPEKVWGIECSEISADWGAQRIKGLSIRKTIAHALKKIVRRDSDLSQTGTETSLIEHFLYPKLGPGQLWEKVAQDIVEMGGEIYLNNPVTLLNADSKHISCVETIDSKNNHKRIFTGDFIFSTMPVKDLIHAIRGVSVPFHIKKTADGLVYRDFITIGLLLKKLCVKTGRRRIYSMLPDNWIYIPEKNVRIGRVQIFNNWSPYMVADPDTVWLGLEYFCNENENLWQMKDDELCRYAVEELLSIHFIKEEDVLDSCIIRMPMAYPAYFGSYDRFPMIRHYLNDFKNLFLIGRNGMHRYNNMDHSMLTAMQAVRNISRGDTNKENIWSVNTETCYHEEKADGL